MADLLTSCPMPPRDGGAGDAAAACVRKHRNADTPGYHRKTISFAEEVAGDRGPSASTDGIDPHLRSRPPDGGEDGYHDGSNVDLVIEIADAREAQRSYEANPRCSIRRPMAQGLFELLRR